LKSTTLSETKVEHSGFRNQNFSWGGQGDQDSVAAGKLFVEHDRGEDDADQPQGAEPAAVFSYKKGYSFISGWCPKKKVPLQAGKKARSTWSCRRLSSPPWPPFSIPTNSAL
jgi:hypothetical protein